WRIGTLLVGLLVAVVVLIEKIPSEFAPKEDRGAFFIIVNGPEGASFKYISEYMDEIERRLMKYVDTGEFERLLVRAPRTFGGAVSTFNTGIVIVGLSEWDKRRSAFDIMEEVRVSLDDLPGVRAFPIMRQGIGSGVAKPVQIT